MTQPKIHNPLYLHLKSIINGALPLEYAIRATQLSNPEIVKKWGELALELRNYWLGLGATDAEIDGEYLMDFAWDTIQVGFYMTHVHNRVYKNQEFLAIIEEGIAGVRSAFEAKLEPLRIPVTSYFRICDLLNGNDIPKLLAESAICLQKASKYRKDSKVGIGEFVKKIREPIFLHDGFQFVTKNIELAERNTEAFGFILDTEADISLSKLKSLIQEFLYQYAVRRMQVNPTIKKLHLSKEIINNFLLEDLHGNEKEQNATRLNSFISKLSGLYCWDRYQYHKELKNRAALDQAITDTLTIYPKQMNLVSEEAIRKNYNETRKKIQELKF